MLVEAIILGLVAILAGALFCFAGYGAFRIVIPIWGAFAGFALGAGVVSSITDDAMLAKPLGWLLGLVLALVFAVFAYLYYWFAIVLAMTSAGWMLGSSLMTALGVSWNWLIILVALAVAVLFAVLAVVTNMPRIVLIVVSALAGATAMVGGAMLLFNRLEVSDLSRATITESIDDSWFWWLSYLLLAAAGLAVQFLTSAREDQVRAAWVAQASSHRA